MVLFKITIKFLNNLRIKIYSGEILNTTKLKLLLTVPI